VELNKEDIEKLLPHKGKATMIDGILEINLSSKKIIATKEILESDPFLEGHFPEDPVLPGYCLFECFNLACAVLAKKVCKVEGVPVILEIKNMKFPGFALPGDTLTIKARITEIKDKNIVVCSGKIINQRNEDVFVIESLEGRVVKEKMFKRLVREAKRVLNKIFSKEKPQQ
jgi:3-hydroxymyristoyl/3-hydroxydecanoyl-(acyl carrier protein) dehydratase